MKIHAAPVRVDGYLAEIGGPRTSFSAVGDLPSEAVNRKEINKEISIK